MTTKAQLRAQAKRIGADPATLDLTSPFVVAILQRSIDMTHLGKLLKDLPTADEISFADAVETLPAETRADVHTLMAQYAPDGILDLGDGRQVRIDRPTAA